MDFSSGENYNQSSVQYIECFVFLDTPYPPKLCKLWNTKYATTNQTLKFFVYVLKKQASTESQVANQVSTLTQNLLPVWKV